jgi:23S rRNA (uracil1939-C5)-methyltransferase
MTAQDTRIVQIEKPLYGGAFLARIDGKAVFVPLSLPGEQARVRLVEEKRSYATAEIEEISVQAAERIAPGCKHFGACGGCHYQHADYAAQIRLKQAILRETLERGGVHAPEEIRVLTAEPWGYRNRIRLAFDAAGNFGYRGRRSHAVVAIGECPIAAPTLVKAAFAFRDVLKTTAPTLRPVELSLFCNAKESALLASVFVAHSSKVRFEDLARAWSEQVPVLTGAELVIEGSRGQQPQTIARWGVQSLAYAVAGFDYRVDHGSFFQVNRRLVDALVVCVTEGRAGKLAWDLFAGVGLFARKLSASFESVVAVESAPSSREALRENLAGVRAKAVSSDTLAFLHQQRGARPDLIVVDPPRTGLGAETTEQLARIAAPAIVYVSCDPATLARDLRALLSSGYAIQSVTLADLFPQTFHLETVVELGRA